MRTWANALPMPEFAPVTTAVGIAFVVGIQVLDGVIMLSRFTDCEALDSFCLLSGISSWAIVESTSFVSSAQKEKPASSDVVLACSSDQAD